MKRRKQNIKRTTREMLPFLWNSLADALRWVFPTNNGLLTNDSTESFIESEVINRNIILEVKHNMKKYIRCYLIFCISINQLLLQRL